MYTATIKQVEVPLYGSDRLGEYKPDLTVDTIAFFSDSLYAVHIEKSTRSYLFNDTTTEQTRYRVVGDKQYELKDHLSNVRALVSDVKAPLIASGMINSAEADVVAYYNYYPFGMSQPLRTYNASDYRYGFNGMEKDDEVKGSGNNYTTEWRQYDPRLGRWFSIDSKVKPSESPYSWVTNNPILYQDPSGLDSTQRANAVAKAKSYVDKNTKPGKSQYVMGAKGEPGKPVDCSGLVSKSVQSGGEQNPNSGEEISGVLNIQNNTLPMNSSDLKPGYLITFYKETGYAYHVGVITDVSYGENGLPTITFAHSEGGYGPKTSTFTKGDGSKYDLITAGFYKWDTKPDYDLTVIPKASQVKANHQINMINTMGDRAKVGTLLNNKTDTYWLERQHQEIQELNKILEPYGQTY